MPDPRRGLMSHHQCIELIKFDGSKNLNTRFKTLRGTGGAAPRTHTTQAFVDGLPNRNGGFTGLAGKSLFHWAIVQRIVIPVHIRGA